MATASTIASFPSDNEIWLLVMYVVAFLSVSLSVAALFVLCFELPFTRVEKVIVGSLLNVILRKSKATHNSNIKDDAQSIKKEEIVQNRST